MFACYDCLEGYELNLNEFLSKRHHENKCNSASVRSSPRSRSPPPLASEQSHNHMLLNKQKGLMFWMWCKWSNNSNDTDFNFFDEQMCSGSWFCSPRGHGGTLVPFCAGSGVDAEGWKQWGQRDSASTQLLHQPDFCVSIAVHIPWDCVCHGLFPSCAKFLSAGFDFQDTSLMFVARRRKRSLESSSCHVRAVVDQIEGYLFNPSLRNVFTISWAWIGQPESCSVPVSHSVCWRATCSDKESEKRHKVTWSAGCQSDFLKPLVLPFRVPAVIATVPMAGQGQRHAWLEFPLGAAHFSGQVFAACEMVSVLSTTALTLLQGTFN